nr:RAMP superfamily CRISPR-associated protein [uncultured Cohaesibacter sp.]
MFGDRIEIECLLKTMTPLHIGTGDEGKASVSGSNEPINYAKIARDNEGKPYLPASSLKGVLRRMSEQFFDLDDAVLALWGTTKLSKKQVEGKEQLSSLDAGQMGQLFVRGGICSGPVPDLNDMPYVKDNSNLKYAYIAARTAIDAASGVAEDHKLFFQEMVPAGTTFSFSMTFLIFGKYAEAAMEKLEKLLQLAMRDGILLGKNQSDGQGEMSFLKVTWREMTLGSEGVLVERKARNLSAASPDELSRSAVLKARQFDLLAQGLFAIADSSRKGQGREVAKEEGTIQVAAQKQSNGQPLIHGSSVSGVLRARADWLWKLRKLREDVDAEQDPVAELFGTTDCKALVEIRKLSVEGAREENITSLKVDRFSGGPVFGALYTTAAFSGAKLSFLLQLTQRGSMTASEYASDLFDDLVKDIKDNGLQLGHGTNKGFGWFKQVEG